jgi:hypothetical protein
MRKMHTIDILSFFLLFCFVGELKPEETPIEQKIKSLLYKIRVSLEHSNKTAKEHIINMIMDIWKQFFATSSPQTQDRVQYQK